MDRTRAIDAAPRGRIRTRGNAGKPVSVNLSLVNAQRFRFGQRWRFGLIEELLELHRGPESGVTAPDSLQQWAGLAEPDTRSPWPASNRFEQDFHAIGRSSRPRGYMAVIDADGNAFGEYREQYDTLEGLAAVSLLIEMTLRRALMTATATELRELDRRVGRATHDRREDQHLQLLKLAGDEWLLLAPAHRGFQIVTAFADAWKKHAEALENDPYFTAHLPVERVRLSELTFGIGLAIAHATAPISHLSSVAAELLASAKACSRSEFAVDWAILKSHDVQPSDVLAGRSGTSGPRISRRPQTLGALQTTLNAVRALHRCRFPRRSLKQFAYRHIEAARHGQVTDPIQRLDLSPEAQRALAGCGADPGPFEVLCARGSTETGWVDAAEMMDIVSREGG